LCFLFAYGDDFHFGELLQAAKHILLSNIIAMEYGGDLADRALTINEHKYSAQAAIQSFQ
jgi:hypothetical protein